MALEDPYPAGACDPRSCDCELVGFKAEGFHVIYDSTPLAFLKATGVDPEAVDPGPDRLHPEP